MSDPYLNCPLCGEQCACRATRDEFEGLRAALEEIVCMQHMHEGSGGCHGPCPVCLAAGKLGFDKYLRNEGDKAKVEELKVKYGYA